LNKNQKAKLYFWALFPSLEKGEGKALRGGKYEGKWRNLSIFLKG